MTQDKVISVLIVDDSAMVRKVLSMGFEADDGFCVAGVAANVQTAQRLLDEKQPDVVTLDIEMPHVNGLTWLRHVMQHRPTPVVIISSMGSSSAETTMQAMELGAVDVIPKPNVGAGAGLGTIMQDIKTRVRAATLANLRPLPPGSGRLTGRPRPAWPRRNGQKIMAIGSSTGGVQALARILPMFPADSPAILIVQHMPEGFTASFAQRLDGLSAMEVREARDGDLVQDGQVLIAPGGMRHMMLRRSGPLYRASLVDGDAVCFSRPSVDVLLRSVAAAAGPNGVGAVLTGMGRDGATGLLAMRSAGARTMAQDRDTSLVYGMPGAAAEIGAAQVILPLEEIPEMMLSDEGPMPAFTAETDWNQGQLRQRPS